MSSQPVAITRRGHVTGFYLVRSTKGPAEVPKQGQHLLQLLPRTGGITRMNGC